MRYAEMTPEQRNVLVDDRDVYPLRVTFLGKAAILTDEEVAFLRQNGVDFDVDQRQADQILAEAARRDVAVLWSGPPVESARQVETGPLSARSLLVWVIAVVASAYGLLRLAARFLRRG